MNVGFVSITESIDTNTPLGAAVFTILGAVAQFERISAPREFRMASRTPGP